MSSSYHSEDIQQIQARLFEEAAKIYERRTGQRRNRLGGFDPLVYMLLGAAASEFEKISLDLHSSWSRMLEQVAHLLTPEVDTGPQPSHGIGHAESIESVALTQVQDQLVAAGHQDQDIFLSPSGRFQLVNGGVRLMCVGDTLYEVGNDQFKQALFRSGGRSNHFEVWLGLELPKETKDLQNLHFFWEWDHQRLPVSPGEFLLTSQWYHEDQELDKELGLKEVQTNDARLTYPIADEFQAARLIEKSVNQYYHDRFLRLQLPSGDKQVQARPYPQSFSTRFNSKDLESLSQELVWIKVHFSEVCFRGQEAVMPAAQLAREVLSRSLCLINCFPLINRRLLEKIFNLNPAVNLFELECAKHFHGIEQVISSRLEREYVQLPFMRIMEEYPSENRSYALRRGGVNRFDSRDARGMLKNFIRYFREENYLFSALGRGVVSSNLTSIEKALNDLETRLNRKSPQSDQEGNNTEPIHIAFPAGESESVIVSYWESAGFAANYIPAGTPLDIYGDSPWKTGSTRLILETLGGRDPEADLHRLQTYKSALITRQRIVTQADILTHCRAELGKALMDIHIKPGVEVGQDRKTGLRRILKVHIELDQDSTQNSWEFIKNRLESQLNEQSTTLVPIRVVFNQQASR